MLPLSQIPEGTVVSNVEARPGDRGIFGRTSGAYAVIVAQVRRLPSGCVALLLRRCLPFCGVWFSPPPPPAAAAAAAAAAAVGSASLRGRGWLEEEECEEGGSQVTNTHTHRFLSLPQIAIHSGRGPRHVQDPPALGGQEDRLGPSPRRGAYRHTPIATPHATPKQAE